MNKYEQIAWAAVAATFGGIIGYIFTQRLDLSVTLAIGATAGYAIAVFTDNGRTL